LFVAEAAVFGAAPVWAKAGRANSAQASRIEGKSFCDTKASLEYENVGTTAKPGSAFAFAQASCRIAFFAVILCRKFAAVAAFSWHLPHHKNAAAINRRELRNYCRSAWHKLT
jgi:hypothetical protein